jgi:serine protease
VVVAAGNENRPAAESSPANCQNVISVGASTRSAQRAPYSNYGPVVDLMAPGGDMSSSVSNGIASTLNDGVTSPGPEAYYYEQGTSMAAPHVAGLAAMLISKSGGSLTPAAVEQRLKLTARSMPGSCLEGCGAGLADAASALGYVAPQPEPESPLTVATPTITGVAGMYRTLTAQPGEWGPAPVNLTYEWFGNGTPIGSGRQLTLFPEHVGDYITVRVTGSKPGTKLSRECRYRSVPLTSSR